jgi:hypothetical protein
MHVNDSQMAQIQSHLKKLNLLIASSLESVVHVLLGHPCPIEEPYSTSSVVCDKIVEALGVISTFLRLKNNTDDLTIETPERHMQRLHNILKRQWNKHRKNFTARHAAQLIGNFVSCLQGCHWLKLLSFEFTRLLCAALSRNTHRF